MPLWTVISRVLSLPYICPRLCTTSDDSLFSIGHGRANYRHTDAFSLACRSPQVEPTNIRLKRLWRYTTAAHRPCWRLNQNQNLDQGSLALASVQQYRQHLILSLTASLTGWLCRRYRHAMHRTHTRRDAES